jgi:hypothetical protein
MVWISPRPLPYWLFAFSASDDERQIEMLAKVRSGHSIRMEPFAALVAIRSTY